MFISNTDIPAAARKTSAGLPCRDPFILAYGGMYYLYHSAGPAGIACSVSGDLETWSAPALVYRRPADFHGVKDWFWAPECHYWKGKFYIFTSVFSAKYNHRCISVYRADGPLGPFEDIAGGCVTVPTWDTIDGTLYVDEQGDPWLVFVHEWTCMPDRNGGMAAARLSEDFTHLVSEPIQLFLARDPAWVTNGVTDGPFLYRTEGGKLYMIWSNFGKDGYAVTQAVSESGKIEGPWKHAESPLYARGMRPEWTDDGGHAMIFKRNDGQWMLSFHSPNSHNPKFERVTFLPISLDENGVTIL